MILVIRHRQALSILRVALTTAPLARQLTCQLVVGSSRVEISLQSSAASQNSGLCDLDSVQ
jgi:hypothetical protein